MEVISKWPSLFTFVSYQIATRFLRFYNETYVNGPHIVLIPRHSFSFVIFFSFKSLVGLDGGNSSSRSYSRGGRGSGSDGPGGGGGG